MRAIPPAHPERVKNENPWQSRNLEDTARQPFVLYFAVSDGAYLLVGSKASSSVTSVSIRSAGDTYSTFLEQGEQICKDLEQGDCIFVQTPAIHLQFSRSSNCFGDAGRSVSGAVRYLVRVEHLWKHSKLTCDTWTVDVNRLQCDQK